MFRGWLAIVLVLIGHGRNSRTERVVLMTLLVTALSFASLVVPPVSGSLFVNYIQYPRDDVAAGATFIVTFSVTDNPNGLSSHTWSQDGSSLGAVPDHCSLSVTDSQSFVAPQVPKGQIGSSTTIRVDTVSCDSPAILDHFGATVIVVKIFLGGEFMPVNSLGILTPYIVASLSLVLVVGFLYFRRVRGKPKD